MGYRCESCMLFCSVEHECESNGLDFDNGSGHITGEITVNLNSACCYDQVASAACDVDHIPGGWEKHCELEGHEVTMEEGEIEPDEMWEPPGRPIRYQRHHYGFNMECTIECSCGETWHPLIKGFIQASDFDQC